jgi:acetyl esterase/lipase/lysophospholipase L1-like esterase
MCATTARVSTRLGALAIALALLQPVQSSLAAPTSAAANSPSSEAHWVSSWATAQQLTPMQMPGWAKAAPKRPPKSAPPSPIPPIPDRLDDQTVRMIVRVGVGGRELRVRLSNALGFAPVAIGAAHVAIHARDSSIARGSDRVLTFAGRTKFVIPPGAVVVSDPVELPVAPSTRLAVSLYVPEATTQLTVHELGLHTTYVARGDATGLESLPDAARNRSYFWLSGVDVLAPPNDYAVVALGDSITDGFGTTPDKDQDWPALLAERLSSGRGPAAAVLNVGISGNRVLHDGTGTNALARFDRDVLGRSGARWVILLEGINDISFPAIPGAPASERITADDLIFGYREIIARAHLHGLKVLGATILPWEGVWTYSEQAEAIRQAVNRWIRSGGGFDGVVDFDAVTRDPSHPTRLRPEFDSGDHVHPNDAGNRAMADAIDASIFANAAGVANAVGVDRDGTVHVPPQAVPPSSFLSPEGRQYLVDHLKAVQHPPLTHDNGVPAIIAGYLERQRALFAVSREETTVGGVHAFIYTPRDGVSARNRHRVLIDLHGGGFAGCWPGCAELESIPIAALGRIRVVSLDYRESPQYRFPAASEDVAAAYRALLASYRPSSIGIYGCSAGGILAGEAVAWFQRHNLPRPGAVGILCAGLTVAASGFGGDSDYTATPIGEARVEALPRPMAGRAGGTARVAMAYFDGTDLDDPLVSPARSSEVLAHFPPTLIISSTRGFDLSAAAYGHAQLVRNGVPAELHVWEGLFHGFFYDPDVPESRECYDVIVKFFDTRLG